ncbi:MAG: class I SAM-dependent methyltransferase [Chloroflexota bacterium]
MSKFTDPTYLKTDQYRDASNLDARIEIHRRFSTNPYGWFNWLFDTLETLPNPARVLELGCGPAYMWKDCADRIPSGWNVTLSDLSDGMLDAAWRNLVVTGRAFKFEQIDAQSIPYPDGTFDIVLANYMLYHVPDRPKALQEIRRVLKSGGYLVAATAGINHLKQMHGWFERLDPTMEMAVFRDLFTLENGLSQLEPFFSQIEIKRYDDDLRVTEIEPLIAYLKSSTSYGDKPESAFARLEQELTAELQSKGAIFVTKDAGLFLARNL